AGLALTASLLACAPGSGTFSDLAPGAEDGGYDGGTAEGGSHEQESGTTQDSGGGTRDSGPGGCTTTPPSNKCGLSPQCGCGPNQTCNIVDAIGNVQCVNAGTAPAGNGCKTTSDCAPGLLCAGFVCKPTCSTLGTQCGPGYGR